MTLPTSASPTSLEAIASEIRKEVEAAEHAWQGAVTHAIRAGELLIEAKAQVRHGEWLPWIEANFPGRPRTAQDYMRLARNARRVAYLPSVREAVAALSEPTGEPARSRPDSGDGCRCPDCGTEFASVADFGRAVLKAGGVSTEARGR
jgi:hypothetical protein